MFPVAGGIFSFPLPMLNEVLDIQFGIFLCIEHRCYRDPEIGYRAPEICTRACLSAFVFPAPVIPLGDWVGKGLGLHVRVEKT